MTPRISRRDFLKLGGLMPISLASPSLLRMLPEGQPPAQGQARNVIVVVFDALSARNTSLDGYGRSTTPNLDRLAQKAIVYHNHYANANFTSAGTASLLTGTLPWTHRALTRNGRVVDWLTNHNIFDVFRDYHRLSYTHNEWANTLLKQFSQYIDDPIPSDRYYLAYYDEIIERLFFQDVDAASVGWTRNVDIRHERYSYSLFLSHLYEHLEARHFAELERLYPRGIPATQNVGSYYLLETAIDSIGSLLPTIPRPFLGYFHLYPPHFPYRASEVFCNAFRADKYRAPEKPRDVFVEDTVGPLIQDRRAYDEFVLNVDSEFNRLYEALERSGVLQDSWLVVTSDHGEMFERGILGHMSHALYEPVLRVPLVIFEPGRQEGAAIRTPTSAIDLLPTLAYVTGHPVPEWCEGAVLPPFDTPADDPNRSIYAMEAMRNHPLAPLIRASAVLVRGRQKLQYHFGHHDFGVEELVRMFDLEADPEELADLYPVQKRSGNDLLAQLREQLWQADRPYV